MEEISGNLPINYPTQKKKKWKKYREICRVTCDVVIWKAGVGFGVNFKKLYIMGRNGSKKLQFNQMIAFIF